jgi:hypothetical protein
MRTRSSGFDLFARPARAEARASHASIDIAKSGAPQPGAEMPSLWSVHRIDAPNLDATTG